jgi:hypothetical protein
MSAENTPSEPVAGENKPDSYSPAGTSAASAARFYRVRSMICTGLLMFIVVVGLPIVSVRGLRQRLGERTSALSQAIYGPVPKLITFKVGENKEPFPEEYRKPVSLAIPAPQPAKIQLTLPPSPPTSPRVLKKVIQAGTQQADAGVSEETANSASGVMADQEQAESGPKFQQGSVEKEAYDLLFAENVSVSDMVSGKNPGLKFKSWSAAKLQEEGTYLVDLAFTRMAENQEEHFIWQVNLATKQITPMSFNARSLPK